LKSKLGQTHTPAARFPDWARDDNGDGRIDIWTNSADILATIAGSSWQDYAGIPVAVAVIQPERPALNASPNVPRAFLRRWNGREWKPEEVGEGGTYLMPWAKGGPAFIMLCPAWPLNSRNPVLPMYAGSDSIWASRLPRACLRMASLEDLCRRFAHLDEATGRTTERRGSRYLFSSRAPRWLELSYCGGSPCCV
jgi:hypothetical protein